VQVEQQEIQAPSFHQMEFQAASGHIMAWAVVQHQLMEQQLVMVAVVAQAVDAEIQQSVD
jgi:hypothetical protein